MLGALSGGRSNRSFLLASGDRKFVLRLNSTDLFLPGNNRKNEIAIWKAASHEGIAPPLLYADADNNFMVSRYIDNSLPAKPPFDNVFTKQAFDLLSRCHKLNIDAPALDYQSHVDNYWQIIENRDQLSNQALDEQRKPMQSALKSLIASDTPTGLCHHDPVVANFVGSAEKLYLVDWEYAARGFLVMDYAALGIEWGMEEESVLKQTGFTADELARAGAVYRYLCDLWQEAAACDA
jgi:thiamine kinase-like enzyme